MSLFVVIRTRGAAWDPAQPLEGQRDWKGHAAFMEALVADGFVRLGGVLEGTSDALLVIEAGDVPEVIARLAEDPWSRSQLLSVSQVSGWSLRLGRMI